MNIARRLFLAAAPLAIAGALVACQSNTKTVDAKTGVPACCAEAAKTGKPCTAACCVEAAKANKPCEKCNKT